jgi:2-polyprenyl-3-methyl-5-hydroxy-6-metoxy-1,4-benzoquinol methylase
VTAAARIAPQESHLMTVPDDWYRSFFGGLIVDFWRAVTTPEMTAEEADGLVRLAGLEPGMRVLDVPCGDGRIALELASRGLIVSGVDISPEFIAIARKAAGERADSFRVADMRDLPTTGQFDAAYCVGNSFGYLTDAENADFLIALSKAMKPGGTLVLATQMLAETLFPVYEGGMSMDFDGIQVDSTHTYLPLTSRVETRYELARAAEHQVECNTHRVYTCREIDILLAAAGFLDRRTFGGWEGEPFDIGCPLGIFVARKGSGPA